MICGIAVSVSSCNKGEDDNKPKQEIVDHIRLDNYTKQQIDDKCRFDIPFWKNGVGKSC